MCAQKFHFTRTNFDTRQSVKSLHLSQLHFRSLPANAMWLESIECSLFYFYAIETRVNSHISTVHKLTALSLWWWSRCSFFFNKISLSNSSQVARLHHLFLFRSARQHADLVSCRCCDEGWQKSPSYAFFIPSRSSSRRLHIISFPFQSSSPKKRSFHHRIASRCTRSLAVRVFLLPFFSAAAASVVMSFSYARHATLFD